MKEINLIFVIRQMRHLVMEKKRRKREEASDISHTYIYNEQPSTKPYLHMNNYIYNEQPSAKPYLHMNNLQSKAIMRSSRKPYLYNIHTPN